MLGIDLNESIVYKHSSFRFFDAHEHHVSRICEDDVLLLVFQGVLRFSEDGRQYETASGRILHTKTEYAPGRRSGK